MFSRLSWWFLMGAVRSIQQKKTLRVNGLDKLANHVRKDTPHVELIICLWFKIKCNKWAYRIPLMKQKKSNQKNMKRQTTDTSWPMVFVIVVLYRRHRSTSLMLTCNEKTKRNGQFTKKTIIVCIEYNKSG